MSRTRAAISKYLATACVAMTLLLSACDTAEERAEAHYQAALAFLEDGDVARAMVEFQNVFKLNGTHKEARLTLAKLERDRGNTSSAYGQYLRLIEQYPDNLEGHQALAEMALELGNWEDVRRHGAFAAELAPDNVEVKSINNMLSYTDAVRANNQANVDLTVRTAREITESHPELMTARLTVIDYLSRNQDWHGVLDATDKALAISPELRSLYTTRLSALQELDKPAEIEALLKRKAQVFPDDPGIEQMLVQHYIDQRNLDAAEQILRKEMDVQSEDYTPVQRLIAFLNEHLGTAAAISEIDKIVSEDGPNTSRLKTLRATLRFQSGDEQTAIAEMQALTDGAERTTQTRENEVEFARMLFNAAQPEQARVLIEKVLAEDPSQVDALKFKTSWLIEEDNTGDAIVLLREALAQAPRDPQLMSLMAAAHERNGDRELMGEMLALAVEVSRNAPEETLHYARFLIAEDDPEIAERVLLDALRQSPDHPGLLFQLGEVYLGMQDWERLEAVQRSIHKLDDPEVRRMANELKAQMLATQERSEELAEFLNELANDPEFGLPADIALIRSMFARGEAAAAFERLDELLEEDPDSLQLRFLKARALSGEGNLDEVEQFYRAILEDHPDATRAWLELYALENERGQTAKAQAILAEALAVLPESPDLLMLQAVNHERAGELDQAIAVYEKLYPLSNRSLAVTNNLASLLTTYRSDDESLQRANDLVRRLRGTRVPAYQDTYGWVAYRMGNYEEARIYLEPAARALPEHPLVLYHLGRTYAALDRTEEALRVYRTAEALKPSLDVTPTLETEIERLEAAPAAGQ